VMASLTWGELGNTGLSTAPLVRELTPTQSFALLELFGAQNLVQFLQGSQIITELDQKPLVKRPQAKCFGFDPFSSNSCSPTDLYGYRCESRATCVATNWNSVCRASC
jgi:hypothetical protein